MAEGNGSTIALGGNAKKTLSAFVKRIETLNEEKDRVSTDIKEVYDEVKAAGFETARLREVIKFRKDDRATREEKEAIRDLYMHALGMISDLPLGEAATSAALAKIEAKRAKKRGKNKPPAHPVAEAAAGATA